MDQALKKRLTSGLLMLAALFGLLWVDHWTDKKTDIGGVGILILLWTILPIATVELAALFAAEQVKPYRVLSSVGSGAIVLHAFLTQFDSFKPVAASTLAFIIVFVMLLAALHRAMLRQAQQAIAGMAGTLLATLYLGGLGWFLLALRVKDSPRFTGSTMVILMILLVVKFTDVGAYFGGRAFGRHKLIAWLSPGKTWEGLACGLIVAALMGALCAPRVSELTWTKAMLFGAIIGGIGQVGDLLESLMKRDAEVKDAGHIIPGFGGVLDVIDSPLLAAPFAYLLFSLF